MERNKGNLFPLECLSIFIGIGSYFGLSEMRKFPSGVLLIFCFKKVAGEVIGI